MLMSMAREVSIASLREEQVARRAGILALFQSLVILFLLVWISEEYNNNQYLQGWAAKYLGGLGFLLGGGLAVVYAGMLTAVYLTAPVRPVKGSETEKEEIVVVVPETRRRNA